MFTAAMLGALVPQALAQLEKRPVAELAGALADAATPYLVNPRHRVQLASVLIETARQLSPGTADGAS